MRSTLICSGYSVCHQLAHGHLGRFELGEVSDALENIDLFGFLPLWDDESKVRRPSEEFFIAFRGSNFVRSLDEMKLGRLVTFEFFDKGRKLDFEFLGSWSVVSKEMGVHQMNTSMLPKAPGRQRSFIVHAKD